MDRWPFKILIDGECPLCKREGHILAWLDRGRKRLVIEDITDAGFDPTKLGVSMQQLMGQIHGVLPDGTLVKGMEVFRRAYEAVGLGWLLAPTRWPILRSVSDGAYAWFARNRMRLAGRCEDGSCGRTGHGADAGRQGAPSREAECRLHTRPAAWGRDEERREGGRNDVSVGLRSA